MKRRIFSFIMVICIFMTCITSFASGVSASTEGGVSLMSSPTGFEPFKLDFNDDTYLTQLEAKAEGVNWTLVDRDETNQKALQINNTLPCADATNYKGIKKTFANPASEVVNISFDLKRNENHWFRMDANFGVEVKESLILIANDQRSISLRGVATSGEVYSYFDTSSVSNSNIGISDYINVKVQYNFINHTARLFVDGVEGKYYNTATTSYQNPVSINPSAQGLYGIEIKTGQQTTANASSTVLLDNLSVTEEAEDLIADIDALPSTITINDTAQVTDLADRRNALVAGGVDISRITNNDKLVDAETVIAQYADFVNQTQFVSYSKNSLLAGFDHLFTFVDVGNFSSNLKDIYVNDVPLTTSQYKLSSGKLLIDKSIFNATGSYTVKMETNDGLITYTTINVKAENKVEYKVPSTANGKITTTDYFEIGTATSWYGGGLMGADSLTGGTRSTRTVDGASVANGTGFQWKIKDAGKFSIKWWKIAFNSQADVIIYVKDKNGLWPSAVIKSNTTGLTLQNTDSSLNTYYGKYTGYVDLDRTFEFTGDGTEYVKVMAASSGQMRYDSFLMTQQGDNNEVLSKYYYNKNLSEVNFTVSSLSSNIIGHKQLFTFNSDISKDIINKVYVNSVEKVQNTDYELKDGKLMLNAAVFPTTGLYNVAIETTDGVTFIAGIVIRAADNVRFETSAGTGTNFSCYASGSTWGTTGLRGIRGDTIAPSNVGLGTSPPAGAYYQWSVKSYSGKYKIRFYQIAFSDLANIQATVVDKNHTTTPWSSPVMTVKNASALNTGTPPAYKAYSSWITLSDVFEFTQSESEYFRVTSTNGGRMLADVMELIPYSDDPSMNADFYLGATAEQVKFVQSPLNSNTANAKQLFTYNDDFDIYSRLSTVKVNGTEITKDVDYVSKRGQILINGDKFPSAGDYVVTIDSIDGFSISTNVTISDGNSVEYTYNDANFTVVTNASLYAGSSLLGAPVISGSRRNSKYVTAPEGSGITVEAYYKWTIPVKGNYTIDWWKIVYFDSSDVVVEVKDCNGIWNSGTMIINNPASNAVALANWLDGNEASGQLGYSQYENFGGKVFSFTGDGTEYIKITKQPNRNEGSTLLGRFALDSIKLTPAGSEEVAIDEYNDTMDMGISEVYRIGNTVNAKVANKLYDTNKNPYVICCIYDENNNLLKVKVQPSILVNSNATTDVSFTFTDINITNSNKIKVFVWQDINSTLLPLAAHKQK